jgi:hypothetical protein
MGLDATFDIPPREESWSLPTVRKRMTVSPFTHVCSFGAKTGLDSTPRDFTRSLQLLGVGRGRLCSAGLGGGAVRADYRRA